MNVVNAWRPSIVGAFLAVMLNVPWAQFASAQEPPGRAAPAAANLAAARTAFEALPEDDRKTLQDALIWTGNYSGVADGVFGRQTFDAMASFQQERRKAPTGILIAAERADLQATAQRAKKAVGFTIVDDPHAGTRIGVPAILLPKRSTNPNGGSRWQSADGRVTLDTRTAPPSATLASLYDRNLALQIPGRVVTYKVLRPDFFVIAGETATGKFYTRYDASASDIRGFSIGYDKAVAVQIDRLVVAIANSFEPFGGAIMPTAVARPAPPLRQPMASLPGGRRLIGTAIVLSPRRVITTAAISACRDMRVGEVQVGGLQEPQTKSWTLIELPSDLPATAASTGFGEAQADEPVLVVGYTMEDGRSTLSVMPGTVSDGQSLIAPLQPGASGAPILDRNNRFVGIVSPVAGDSRKIAGIITTGRHGFVPSRDLAAAIPGSRDTGKTERTEAADMAAFWKSVLLPLTCAP